MALQDLTPELRTRLGRVERWVGVFVALATLLLLVGLGYYLYQTAKRKGWFLVKVPYHTYVQDASGLKVGDPVKLMGFDVGEITQIEAMGPYDYYNVYLQFRVKQPYYGYLWTDSQVRVASKDLLGGRYLEVTKGSYGSATVKTKEGQIGEVLGVLDLRIKTNATQVPVGDLPYVALTNGSKGYWLSVVEAPALTERLERVVDSVEEALPNFLSLTNQVQTALGKVGDVAVHADQLLVSAQPVVSNLNSITAHLSNPKGSLGEWLMPEDVHRGLAGSLDATERTLDAARTNIAQLSASLLTSLDNVAGLTSNLNAQVQANDMILSEVSSLIVTADEFVQGLKRHWLFKGAFGAPGTNQTVPTLIPPRLENPLQNPIR